MYAFIPSSFINSFGVVHNIPIKYSEKNLIAKIVSDVAIKSIFRFKSCDIDDPKKILTNFFNKARI